ncbi:protein translocase subunit [Malassezia vespertilionis]|uniref:Mitochondrial import inner membrane translocase subunit TIM44 n=1 Tax=Malassezia vespertilionis TaxID=2020962 RepID=A0A2N1JCD6_9BASI|nr:protein translocase subunit [Malassezia vespertilionis]PKI84192.1 Tim44p [Malassezia vespertilionis]WFD06985.1 protein translocase subunit [Malassezia vespertilionis]
MKSMRAVSLGQGAALGSAHGAMRAPHMAVRALHASRPALDTPRSPFQVFVQTLREELTKSREFQENMRQLQGRTEKFQDTETMRKAREAYDRARIISSIKHNPRLQYAAEQLRKSGGTVGSAVSSTLKQMEESELMRSLSSMTGRMRRQLEDSTAPVRNTEVYKAFAATISEAFDDGSDGINIHLTDGMDAKEVRRLKREKRLRKIGKPPPVEDVEASAPSEAKAEDPIVAAAAAAGEAAGRESAGEAAGRKTAGEAAGAAKPAMDAEEKQQRRKRLGGYAVTTYVAANEAAGQDMVLAPESAQKKWRILPEDTAVHRKMDEWNEQFQDSEHPVVERIRGITNTVASWFAENETAQVSRAFKQMDPTFTMAGFTNDLREYVIPEVLDAYHTGQRHLLRQWCSEATYNVLMATIDPYLQRGYIPDGRILDLSSVEIIQGKMLETGPMPVLVVSFQTQELMYFTDPRSNEIKEGSVEQANLCRYAMVMTRAEDELRNEITGGWKIVELARRGQIAFM